MNLGKNNNEKAKGLEIGFFFLGALNSVGVFLNSI